MPYMVARATLLMQEKLEMPDGAIVEIIVWRLPRPTADRPHGFKYRLYFGRGGKCQVRYDNEAGKGDHRHVGGQEHPYRFVSARRLREDFWADVVKLGGYDASEKKTYRRCRDDERIARSL